MPLTWYVVRNLELFLLFSQRHGVQVGLFCGPALGQGLGLSTPCKSLPCNVTKEALPQAYSSAFIIGINEIDKPGEIINVSFKEQLNIRDKSVKIYLKII